MGGGAHFPSSADYDAEELRQACTKVDDEDDEPLPNYECQTCEKRRYIEDHKRIAPSYCEHCETVRSHIRLDAKEE